MITLLIQKIKGIDIHLFYFINQGLQNPFLDKWMPIITDINNWIWILVLGWFALFIFGGRRGRLACVLVIIAVLIADNLTSYIIKPFFSRPRPAIALGLTNLVSSSPSPSFPSNHAVNVFTIAFILSWYYRRLSLIWFIGASIVGFSRVYVGVHYPFDIIGGAFFGILCALCVIWVGNWVTTKLLKMCEARPRTFC